MLPTTWFALILGVWSCLYFVDAFLKSRNFSRRFYIDLLGRSGLKLSTCNIRWYTTHFNRLFMRLGHVKPQFLNVWFTVGVFVSLIAMFLSMVLLSLLIVNTLSNRKVHQQVLTPVMPGINLPSNHISYYLLTLFVCAVLHEVGHAVAAVRENVKVNGFGIFVMLIYPGAFVELSSEQIRDISPLRQLRIYCAGVWHNFIVVLVALAVLALLPLLLLPFYSTGLGAVITHVEPNSAVSGPRGLTPGSCVTSISGCPVKSSRDWMSCITSSIRAPTPGRCMSRVMVAQLDTRTQSDKKVLSILSSTTKPYIDCCNTTSSTHLCYSYRVKSSKTVVNKKACLPARVVTERPHCKLRKDCVMQAGNPVCVHPAVDNNTKLLRILHSGKRSLLFLGHPADLHYSVTVNDYKPRSRIFPLHLPYIADIFCKYMISFSGALLILNVVPCYALDGHLICHSFIELALRPFQYQIRRVLYLTFTAFGTFLLVINVIISLWSLFS